MKTDVYLSQSIQNDNLHFKPRHIDFLHHYFFDSTCATVKHSILLEFKATTRDQAPLQSSTIDIDLAFCTNFPQNNHSGCIDIFLMDFLNGFIGGFLNIFFIT